ncbi:MAG TPA: peptidoglycan DD-metalloendopeptidase family protein [Anaerovoracaceae bacterium]|nr:peptidoglycan DD-metalloendopeptidase family protein [Anaerovoracaceae bacterium]
MKVKHWICCSLATVLIISLFSPMLSFGGSQDKLNELNRQIDKLQTRIKAGKAQEAKLSSEIKNLDCLIEEAECEIRDLQYEIEKTNKEIAIVEAQMKAKKEEIKSQNDEMGSRIRAMYKNGDVGLLEVLLGSTGITDFLTNLDMAQKIFDNDVSLLEKLEDQHKAIESQCSKLESLRRNLKAKEQSEATKQDQLQISRGDVSQLKSQVSDENKTLARQVDKLNEEANAFIAEILRLQGGGDYVGGGLAWPAPSSKRVTSEFGYRLHPILKVNKLHTGLDIGVASGSQVVAANDGKVIKAAWNNSYGYMVMIDHGGGIVTLYAHNSQLKVKTGDIVVRGQTIALSGNTGASTGPHLHFEVRVNGVYKDPRNYL